MSAQEARRALDRVVGYPLSNLLGKKVTRGLSAGRVQSVAVKLVVDREREIEAFKTEEYWKITALLTPQGLAKLGDFEFPAKVFAKKKGPKPADEKADDKPDAEPKKPKPPKPRRRPSRHRSRKRSKPRSCRKEASPAELDQWQGKSFKAATEADVDAVYNVLNSAAYAVTKIEQKDRNDNAPPPFTTSTLQQAASTRLSMGAQRAMQNAQRLYEGVNLGHEGQVALITYMRTDSTRVSNDALQMVRGAHRQQLTARATCPTSRTSSSPARAPRRPTRRSARPT